MKKLWILLITILTVTMSSAFADGVDLKKSSFKWLGTKVTGKHYGKIYLKSGNVTLKQGQIHSGEFIADMNTFTVDDLEGEWEKKFLTHMKSEDFFTVKKYPTSKLVIKSVKDGIATANLTIKGKTNSVVFKIFKEGRTYSGTLKFDRTQFDMIYGSGNFFKNLGDKLVHNEVSVDFKFVLENK